MLLSSLGFTASLILPTLASQVPVQPIKLGGCFKRSSDPFVFNPTCDWHDEPGIDLERVLAIESSTPFRFDGPIEKPWSSKPFCIDPVIQGLNHSEPVCLYTSRSFAGGRGISIVTTPSQAKLIAKLPAFTDPSALQDVNAVATPPYEARALPGRGIGLIANKTLFRGDEIFSHTPVLVVNERAYGIVSPGDVRFLQDGGVARLPDASRKLFLELHGHFGEKDVINDIINTNAFDVEISTTKDDHLIVPPEASRMNHDCRPNAHYYLDPDTLAHHVHAIRTIHPGEEITISYIDVSMVREARLAKLKRNWGFDCNCSRCTQPRIFTDASDERLREIERLTQKVGDKTWNRTATTEDTEMLISLYEQERMDAPIAEAYVYAALEESYLGNREGARKYAALAIERETLYGGPKDDDVAHMRTVWETPEQHWSWRFFAKSKDTTQATEIRE